MDYTLKVEERTEQGKSASQKMRHGGNIPAVIYGHGDQAIHLSVNEKEFLKLLDIIKGRNPIINLTIGDKPSTKAIIKSMQRAAVTKKLLSIDFQKIHADEKIIMNVPVVLKGTAIGIKEGGILDQTLRSIPIRGRIDKIPDHIEVDISELKLGHTIHIADLKLTDIEFMVPIDSSIVSVLAPKKVVEVAAPVAEEITEPEVITEKKREEGESESEAGGKKKSAGEAEAKK
ncbi:MAG: 50S ribosomal protein L25 [Candidatus Latescibacteria bacterium]|nr:50S ribosomal protein L25 [Candidatus Latescibacterota bacterium]